MNILRNNFIIRQQRSLLYRISTFCAWKGTSVLSPLTFAKCGFYYPGNNDSVVCSECNTHLDGWNTNDDPQERHKRIAPDCPFVKGDSSGNVFLTLINNPGWTFTANDIATATVTDNADLDVDRAFPQAASFEPLKQLYFSVLQRTRRKGLLSNDSDFQKDQQLPDFDKLRLEEERLLTFRTWPASAQANPEALARAGLFYTGSGDRVQCAFCRGFIHDWKPSDSPATEHKKLYPDCTFARDLEVEYDPIARDLTPAEDRIRNENDGESRNTGSYPPRESVRALTAEQIPRSLLTRRSEFPKYPQYSELFARLQSLIGGIVAPGQTAQGLADAGWFYIGPGDKVLCFHCGGNLKDWEYEDDPWEEHEKWYPDCFYLLNHRPASRVQMPNPTPPPLSNRFHYVEPREIKARMDTPTTRAVLDMGFSKDLVKSAIEKRLFTTGDDFPNAQSLVEAVFQLEEEPRMPSHPAPVSGLRQNSAILQGYNSFSNTTSGKKNKKKTPTSASGGGNQSGEMTVTTYRQNNKEQVLENLRLGEVPDEEPTRYIEENRRMREARTCKFCKKAEVNTVFLPCGHLVCCNNCAPDVRNCLLCRGFIRGTVKTFLS